MGQHINKTTTRANVLKRLRDALHGALQWVLGWGSRAPCLWWVWQRRNQMWPFGPPTWLPPEWWGWSWGTGFLHSRFRFLSWLKRNFISVFLKSRSKLSKLNKQTNMNKHVKEGTPEILSLKTCERMSSKPLGIYNTGFWMCQAMWTTGN